MSQTNITADKPLKNETLSTSSNDSQKLVKLNEKMKKYEEIIEKKNKEITVLQLDQDNYKKKFSNYSEHNSSIAIRNASLERTLREIAIEKLKVEKENMKLKENVACLEGQLSEQRLMMKEFLASQHNQQHVDITKIAPTPASSYEPSSIQPVISNVKIEKPFQLKITKYLKKPNTSNGGSTATIINSTTTSDDDQSKCKNNNNCMNRTPPRREIALAPQQPLHINNNYYSPPCKSPERSTARKKQPYHGRYKLTPIKKNRIDLHIQQALIENAMLDEDEILF